MTKSSIQEFCVSEWLSTSVLVGDRHGCVLAKERLNNEEGIELLIAGSLALTWSLSVVTASKRWLFGDLCTIGSKGLVIIHIPKSLTSPGSPCWRWTGKDWVGHRCGNPVWSNWGAAGSRPEFRNVLYPRQRIAFLGRPGVAFFRTRPTCPSCGSWMHAAPERCFSLHPFRCLI